MAKFSLGFEFEDRTWSGHVEQNNLTYADEKVWVGAANTAQRIAPFAICTNPDNKPLWYLSLDGEHVEIITAPIYDHANEYIGQITQSIRLFLAQYRKEGAQLNFENQANYIKLNTNYKLKSNKYTGTVNFKITVDKDDKDGERWGLLYPQFTVNLPTQKLFTFFKNYFEDGFKNNQLGKALEKKYYLYFEIVKALIEADIKEEFYLSYIINVLKLFQCDESKHFTSLKFLFFLLPRTCVSSTITQELYDELIKHAYASDELPAYLKNFENSLQEGTKKYFRNAASWYSYAANLYNRMHLVGKTTMDAGKITRTYNTRLNDQEYYEQNIRRLKNKRIITEYMERYIQRDVLSPPPFIPYSDFSSTGLCTFAPFNEDCVALEARNNATNRFGINSIKRWNELEDMKTIHDRISLWLEPPVQKRGVSLPPIRKGY